MKDKTRIGKQISRRGILPIIGSTMLIPILSFGNSTTQETVSKLKVNILGQYLITNEAVGNVVFDVDKESSKRLLIDLKKVKHTIKVRSLY